MKYKHRIVSVMMILCMLLSCMAFPSFAGSDNYIKLTATQNYSDAQLMLRCINDERTKRGLARLKLDQSLTKAAAMRAAELIIYIPKSSPHRRPNGKLRSSIDSRIIYECCCEGTANAATNPITVVDGWMHSSDHRKGILLKNAKSVGIGCITSKDGDKYWTLEFSSAKARKIEKRKNKKTQTYKIPVISRNMKKDRFYLSQVDYYNEETDPEWTDLHIGLTAKIRPVFINNYNFHTQLRYSDYIWSSSNESVASIDSKGTVTPKKTGSVTIYAKMKASPGYTLKRTFKVEEATEHYYYDEATKLYYLEF
ncbi:MAG: Ig-like domain-containing protein [Mogibacterium sp.]|nr:Ig-like domain-containing protein [Mogibacterium sp.]